MMRNIARTPTRYKHPTVTEVLARLPSARSTGDSTWRAACPAHFSKSGRSTSLSITDAGIGTQGRALVYCFSGCSYRAILEALGLDHETLRARAARAADLAVARALQRRRGRS